MKQPSLSHYNRIPCVGLRRLARGPLHLQMNEEDLQESSGSLQAKSNHVGHCIQIDLDFNHLTHLYLGIQAIVPLHCFSFQKVSKEGNALLRDESSGFIARRYSEIEAFGSLEPIQPYQEPNYSMGRFQVGFFFVIRGKMAMCQRIHHPY